MTMWLYVGISLMAIGLILGAAVGLSMDEGFLTFVMCAGVGWFAGFLLAIVPIEYAAAHWNEHWARCTVLDKDRGGNDGGMRVYTSCGTFGNEDMLFRGKTRSADLWPKIHPGQVQEFRVVGWRNGFLSDFPNVLEVK
jgi:hypothetical protein